ncbi:MULTISPECIES: hypothetical protein [Actinoplanes]|uniref:alpha/beta fold hydrolase n=1 Tax=Actinoplanes TaxID=1865 RepID=UPI00069623C3|nr:MULTISPECIES: hypothetical protein [Actinoplanes]GLY02941.1 hypothetical protein Acsp01_33200 [Actinoplanes sp. NBRC 101535]
MQVDLLGLSLGGMVAQVIAHREAHLVRKLILAGTGPAGGTGITKVTRLSNLALLRGALARQDPKKYLFFTRTANSVHLAERLPNSELVLYPDAGHGGIFQHHAAFTATALAFLAR